MFNWAFFIIFILYAPAAFAGYYAFGEAVQSPIFATVGISSGILIDIAMVAITLHLWLTMPLVNNPLNLWAENIFKIDNRKPEIVWRAISRTLLLGLQGTKQTNKTPKSFVLFILF